MSRTGIIPDKMSGSLKEEIRRQSKKNTGRKGKDKARNSEKAKK